MSFWAQFSPDETTYYPLESNPSVYWKIKAPSFSDERKIARWMTEDRRTSADVQAYEIGLTFLATTFPHSDLPTQDPSEKGFVPGLKKGASVEEVIAYLDTIPSRVVDEIWKKLVEVAPHWGPRFPR